MSSTDPTPDRIVIRLEDLVDRPIQGDAAPPVPPASGWKPIIIPPPDSRPTRTRFTPVLVSAGVLGLVLIVVFLALAFSTGRNSVKAEATVRYWHRLCAIDARISSLGSDVETKSIAESKKTMSTYATMYRAAAEEISGLDVGEVDESLVELGGLKLKLFGDSGILCDQLAEMLARRDELIQRSSSVEMLVESFLRGFLGDPLGTTREMQVEGKNLDARQHELVDQARRLQVGRTEVTARTHKIRAELTSAIPASSWAATEVSLGCAVRRSLTTK